MCMCWGRCGRLGSLKSFVVQLTTVEVVECNLYLECAACALDHVALPVAGRRTAATSWASCAARRSTQTRHSSAPQPLLLFLQFRIQPHLGCCLAAATAAQSAQLAMPRSFVFPVRCPQVHPCPSSPVRLSLRTDILPRCSAITARRVCTLRPALAAARSYDYGAEPFSVRRKDFWPLYRAHKVQAGASPSLHGPACLGWQHGAISTLLCLYPSHVMASSQRQHGQHFLIYPVLQTTLMA
jgi:hypothetical protein